MVTEAEYLRVCGTERSAVEFENAALTRPKSELPRCAHDVLDGNGASSEYWAWLIVEWFGRELARIESESPQ